jgi:hypothetical protein
VASHNPFLSFFLVAAKRLVTPQAFVVPLLEAIFNNAHEIFKYLHEKPSELNVVSYYSWVKLNFREETMKKLALAALFALLGTLAVSADPKPYDSAAISDVMHSNGATYGAVKKAIDASDWTAAATGFKQFAANAETAMTYAPPKGDPAQWTKIWTDFESAANAGVDAANAKDAVKAKAALDQIGADRGKGHAAFK